MAGMHVEIKVDNSGQVLNELPQKVERALTKIGIVAQKYSKEELENHPRRVDTGRLKGSIAYDVQGDTAVVGTNVEYAA